MPLVLNISTWFSWARKQRIVLAMSGGVVYTAEGEAVAVALDDAQMPFERVKPSKIY
ncbi:MAG: hypothetical protein PUP90_03615 [Nostoc sp. S4]|nr:hypothetical protein [Nostoc sp. S4]